MDVSKCFKLLLLSLLTAATLLACDATIEPITMESKQYSIYGPLNISTSPNYLRVHNSQAVLNSEATQSISVNMEIVNLKTGSVENLEDRIVKFDSIYTHNFEVNMPIEFDTRYRIDLEDQEAEITSSLVTVTTKKSEIEVLKDSVGCNSAFQIQLSNIDLEAGERVDAEVAIKIGNEWYWTPREMSRLYNQATNTLILSWTPNEISRYILGPFNFISCCEFTSKKIRFRFTHIGYIEENGKPDATLRSTNKQIVLSKYSDEAEIKINPCRSVNKPVACKTY